MNDCHGTTKVIRSCAGISIFALVSVLVAGCYASVSRHDGTSQDGTEDYYPDIPVDHPGDLDVIPDYPTEDLPADMDCRTIAPTVTYADFNLDGCTSPEPYVTAIVNEVSPFCGVPITWTNDYEWIDELTVLINPTLYMCSDTWQYCDPGAVNTAYVDIYVPARGTTYTAIVGGIYYNFMCQEQECPFTQAYLTNVYPADYRPYRLWGTTEDIMYEVSYTTGACGCSTFEPLVMSNLETMDSTYYYGTLSAQICYDYCCWTCDCIDEGWSEQLIRNPGNSITYESILEGLYKDIRGFVVDDMANPMSECVVSPATITAVSTSRAYYDVSEPIDVSATVRFDSTASSCCETHSEVAFDLSNSSNEIYLFAFKGDCLACYDDSCPPSEVKSLRISPNVLSMGEYRVYDSTTGTFLYRFYITGGD